VTFVVDRLLSPRTVNRASVALESGGTYALGTLRYDPARRLVTFAPIDPTTVVAQVRYTLIIGTRLEAWDGVPLADNVYRYALSVAGTPETSHVVAPSLRTDVAPLLAAHCGFAGCHGGATPVMGLDLSSASAVLATAVAMASRERPPDGTVAVQPSDPQWGAMMRIDPGVTTGVGRPEYSYLLYKVLGDGPLEGSSMPPPDAPALSQVEIETLSDWIAAGAPNN
jgi:hypothetical protein